MLLDLLAIDLPSRYGEPLPQNPPALMRSLNEEDPPLTLFDQANWKVILSGVAQTAVMVDSTRSYNEWTGNAPVLPGDVPAGTNGRTQFSLRDSRLAFRLFPPPLGTGGFTQLYFEFDFMGYDPTIGRETDQFYFSSPSPRLKHGYFQVQGATGWSLIVGQTWQLFGWQPYYYLSTVNFTPLAAMIHGRAPQIRLMKTWELGEQSGLQWALAMVKPVQRDGLVPDFQMGFRWEDWSLQAPLPHSGADLLLPQPLSLAISGTLRTITVPAQVASLESHYQFGSAVAVNLLVPLVSRDSGNPEGESLSFSAEASVGSGYGDQFGGFTGNTANSLNQSVYLAPSRVELDGGIGDYNANQQFALINLWSLNAQLQYHFAAVNPTWMTLGVGQLFSQNRNQLTPAGNLSSAGSEPYNRNRMVFANLFHEFAPRLRAGLEFSYAQTYYASGQTAENYRGQFSAYFVF